MPSLKRSVSKKAFRVLITSGPTSVPIDAMRVITNRSTGEMGRLIANCFSEAGMQVTLLEGAVTTAIPVRPVRLRKFYTYSELQTLLYEELRRPYDIIVHAAAVSDFVPRKNCKGKLASNDKITLDLVPTKKLILEIKKRKPDVFLVGFKLEPDISKKNIFSKVDSLFEQAGCRLAVINRFDVKGYQAYIMKDDRSMTNMVTSKKELVKMLVESCLVSL